MSSMKRQLKKNPIYVEDLYEKDNFTFGTYYMNITTEVKGFNRPGLLKCKGFYDEYNGDYDCKYPLNGEITCDECLVNYGLYDPSTGKRISH